jgi:hypothetical protein
MPSDIKKYIFPILLELGFWSHTGLNLAHGIIVTFSGHYACADATP